MEGEIGEGRVSFGDEFISKDFAAGVAEGRLARVRDNFHLVRMVWARILMVAEFLWISAREGFVYDGGDIVRDRVSVFG